MDCTKQFFYVKIKYKNNFIPFLPSFLDPCNWKQTKDFFFDLVVNLTFAKYHRRFGCLPSQKSEAWKKVEESDVFMINYDDEYINEK